MAKSRAEMQALARSLEDKLDSVHPSPDNLKVEPSGDGLAVNMSPGAERGRVGPVILAFAREHQVIVDTDFNVKQKLTR